MNPTIIRQIEITENPSIITIVEKNGQIIIERKAVRSRVKNNVSHYEKVINNESKFLPLNLEIAHRVLDRLEAGINFAAAFLFYEGNILDQYVQRYTTINHSFQSTGEKYWLHQEQMFNYKEGGSNTIVTAHISPEGACNLKCPFCSVTFRSTHLNLKLEVIQDFVEKLQSRGLKAVTLTGGGEPTVYKEFEELVEWLHYERGLELGVITNGTQLSRFSERTMKAFEWIRVSINIFKGWEEKISVPTHYLKDDCLVGCSFVYTAQHEAHEQLNDRLEFLKKLVHLADKFDAKYIRLIPDCFLGEKELAIQHLTVDRILQELNDPRVFHAVKAHKAPKASICHRAFFRPYLSQEPWRGTGEPGAVFPCGSIAINATDPSQYLKSQYQVCHARDILKFLDGEIKPQFEPKHDCHNCVYTRQIDLLEDWKTGVIEQPLVPASDLIHPNFL